MQASMLGTLSTGIGAAVLMKLSLTTFSRGGLLFAVLLFGGLLAGGLWLRLQLQIDRCLDAGGRWNDDYDECEDTRRP